MKKHLPLLLVSFFLLFPGWAFAQNLLDNAEYRKGLEYQNLAKQAYNEGDYDKSVEYSELAQEQFRKAREYAEKMRLRFAAYNLRSRATERIRYADYINAAANYPTEYRDAKLAFSAADLAFNKEEYAVSIEASRKVLEILRDIQPVVRQADQVAATPAPAPTPPPPAEPTLPEYYTVRLIPERRDCFWRIAEYDFIYGDPWKWRILYEENKSLLPNPNNPSLIEPGIRLRIPSLAGEKRSGEWQPPEKK